MPLDDLDAYFGYASRSKALNSREAGEARATIGNNIRSGKWRPIQPRRYEDALDEC